MMKNKYYLQELPKKKVCFDDSIIYPHLLLRDSEFLNQFLCVFCIRTDDLYELIFSHRSVAAHLYPPSQHLHPSLADHAH